MKLAPLLNPLRPRGNDKRHRRFRPALILLEDRTVLSPTVFTVTGIGDSASDPYTATSGDLRYCVFLADTNTSNPAGSLIQFSSTVFNVPQTITLVGSGLVLSNTNAPTTITGPSAALTVSGGGSSSNFSVFTVNSGVTASLAGLTIANGYTSGNGGGIDNEGMATLTDLTLSGNSAYDGGGIENSGTATLTDATLSGNSAYDGGGMGNSGTAMLIDVTLSGNAASYGGGIGNHATVTLDDVTIAGNSAVKSGGIAIGGTATLNNTIVANNSGGDIDFGNVSGDNNLIDDACERRRVDQRGQRQRRGRQPAAVAAGQLRRADSDHGLAPGQPGHRRGQ